MSSWRKTDDKAGVVLTLWRPLPDDGGGDADGDADAEGDPAPWPALRCALCGRVIGRGEMRHVNEWSSVDGSGRRDPPWQREGTDYYHPRCQQRARDGWRFVLAGLRAELWRHGHRGHDWDD